jgi:porin
VHGGIADANSDPSRVFDGFGGFFDTSEYFWHVEAGWIGSWANRYSDNIHVSFWTVDDRVEAGVDGGWGLAASLSHTLGERWQPFLRGGYADGGGPLLARSVSAGTGYQLMERGDLVGIGANWGRAPTEAVEGDPLNQWTMELYYKTYQIPQVEVWPSFQFLFNPAYLPEETNLWLISIRARLTL